MAIADSTPCCLAALACAFHPLANDIPIHADPFRRAFFPEIYGLPSGYNAFRTANFGTPAEWERVHVVHDVWKNRGSNKAWATEVGANVSGLIDNLNRATISALAGLPTVGKTKLKPGERHTSMPF